MVRIIQSISRTSPKVPNSSTCPTNCPKMSFELSQNYQFRRIVLRTDLFQCIATQPLMRFAESHCCWHYIGFHPSKSGNVLMVISCKQRFRRVLAGKSSSEIGGKSGNREIGDSGFGFGPNHNSDDPRRLTSTAFLAYPDPGDIHTSFRLAASWEGTT